MLKNLDPMLTGPLLRVLDAMAPGEWLALTAGPASGLGLNEGHTVIDLSGVAIEAAAQALLSVLPLDRSETPIAYLNETGPAGGLADGLPDVACAVCGIAADAELRRVPMSSLCGGEFRALAACAAATVRTDSAGVAAAFLLRKGGRAAF